MEERLTGGRLTRGVVRIGETVRRPTTPASAFVATLLTHLADRDYAGSPRYLGVDEVGRDTLSFIPGRVVERWRRYPDTDIASVAALLRDLHEASRDLVDRSAGFSPELYSGYTGSDAVICHHDPGPNNVVFAGGAPVAFIDFDFAAPGHRLEDVGYLAWSWCVSSRPDRGPATEQGRQARVLADAYGLNSADRCRLLAAVRARLARNLAFWRRRLDRPWSGNGASPRDVIAWTKAELAFITEHRDAFVRQLGAH